MAGKPGSAVGFSTNGQWHGDQGRKDPAIENDPTSVASGFRRGIAPVADTAGATVAGAPVTARVPRQIEDFDG